MKDHLAQKVHWRYVINLPGQAFPLRTPEEMIDILRVYNGTNDIEGIYRRRLLHRYQKVRRLVQCLAQLMCGQILVITSVLYPLLTVHLR